MDRSTDAHMERLGRRKVASGTWYYDRTVPMRISVWAKPAAQASSRYDDDDQLDESRPIPTTVDGFLYFCWPGGRGEHQSVDAAKAETDYQPWAPVTWDQ